MNITSSTSARLTAVGSLALLFSASLPVASAADLTWINAGATADWDTSSLFWNDGSNDVAWTDNNAALFVGNGVFRTITLSQDVQATAVRGDGTLGGTIKLTGGSFKLAVPLFNTTANANFDVDVAITGSQGLIKTGNGRITLYQTSDYTGATELNADNVGTGFSEIYIKANNGLSASSSFNIVGGTTKSRLVLNGAANGSAGVGQTFTALTGNGRIMARTGHNTLTINTANGATSTFSGILNEFNSTTGQTLSLVINGEGTQALTGASNTYVGTTTISGGTLLLGSNLSGTSAVTVDGGELASSIANVNLGVGDFTMTSGILSANGAAIGSYTLAATKDFNASGGMLDFTLGAGDTSDTIFGSGLDSEFTVSGVTLALHGTTSVAGTYTLFSGFAGGSVSDVTITGLAEGFTGTLNSDGTFVVASIPEPSTYAGLAGLAMLGFAALRRRSHRA